MRIFKWLKKKVFKWAIKGHIKDFMKDVHGLNLKEKVGNYIKENEEEIIENIIEKIEAKTQIDVEKVLGKIVARYEDQA